MAIGGAPRAENEFDVWLEQVTQRGDPLMASLGVLSALLVGFELAVDVSPRMVELHREMVT